MHRRVPSHRGRRRVTAGRRASRRPPTGIDADDLHAAGQHDNADAVGDLDEPVPRQAQRDVATRSIRISDDDSLHQGVIDPPADKQCCRRPGRNRRRDLDRTIGKVGCRHARRPARSVAFRSDLDAVAPALQVGGVENAAFRARNRHRMLNVRVESKILGQSLIERSKVGADRVRGRTAQNT